MTVPLYVCVKEYDKRFRWGYAARSGSEQKAEHVGRNLIAERVAQACDLPPTELEKSPDQEKRMRIGGYS